MVMDGGVVLLLGAVMGWVGWCVDVGLRWF